MFKGSVGIFLEGPYQRTPKQVAIKLLDTQVYWVR